MSGGDRILLISANNFSITSTNDTAREALKKIGITSNDSTAIDCVSIIDPTSSIIKEYQTRIMFKGIFKSHVVYIRQYKNAIHKTVIAIDNKDYAVG